MHLAGVQGYALTHIAARTVLILETKEIVLVTETRLAPAEAWELFEDLWNIFGRLVRSAGFLIAEQAWRENIRSQSRVFAGLASRSAQ